MVLNDLFEQIVDTSGGQCGRMAIAHLLAVLQHILHQVQPQLKNFLGSLIWWFANMRCLPLTVEVSFSVRFDSVAS